MNISFTNKILWSKKSNHRFYGLLNPNICAAIFICKSSVMTASFRYGKQVLKACWNLKKGVRGRWNDEKTRNLRAVDFVQNSAVQHISAPSERSTNKSGWKLLSLEWMLTAGPSYRAFSGSLLQLSCMWVTELGWGSASGTSGWTAVPHLRPSARCLFTCWGMQSHTSPNLPETTWSVTRATYKHIHTCLCRSVALVASGSAYANGTAQALFNRAYCPHCVTSIYGNSPSCHVSTLRDVWYRCTNEVNHFVPKNSTSGGHPCWNGALQTCICSAGSQRRSVFMWRCP